MNGQNSSLGELMNPMQPQGRVPSMPQQSMISPNASKQPAGVPQAPQAPQMPAAPAPAMMPQQGPSIIDLMMQRILAGAGQGSMAIPGVAPDTTQIAPGLQTAPVRGTTPTIGGR